MNGFFETQKRKTSSQKAEEEYKEKKTENPQQTQKSVFEKEKNFSDKAFSDAINEIFKDFTSRTKTPPKPKDGDDIETEVTIGITEALKGTTRTVNVLHSELCTHCKGRKFINGAKCSVCNGTGEKTEHRKISVKIPAKIKDGTKLRLKDEGNKGQNGGKNGDLYVCVKIEGNSQIQYDGLNILYNIPITPYEAALGGDIDINTPAGNITLKLPKNTNSGQKFRLSGLGIHQKNKSGDVIVTVHIEIPHSLSDDEIKLYEKLKKIASNDIRKNLFND